MKRHTLAWALDTDRRWLAMPEPKWAKVTHNGKGLQALKTVNASEMHTVVGLNGPAGAG
jgi:hypothetical protein